MSSLSRILFRNRSLIFNSSKRLFSNVKNTKFIPKITSINSKLSSYNFASQAQEQMSKEETVKKLINALRNDTQNKTHNIKMNGVDKSIAGDLPLTELVRDFLAPSAFYDLLQDYGHDFFVGVPDSLLKDLCAYVTDNTDASHHIITPNEGNAIGVATGYHLATGKIPIVYLQNSGLGNAVNPLLSLADRKVCNVPILILLGWRGEPGRKDEPQHMVQGKITTALLADMNIPFEILPDYIEGANEALETAQLHFQQRGSPYCLLVRKRTFSPYKLKNKSSNNYKLTREQVLNLIINNTNEWDAFVTTTGFTSRELYELRKLNETSESDKKKKVIKDLLMVGSMGHASSISLGIAISKPSRNIITLDGDGALLMHTGILSTIGSMKPKNFKHILLNNGAHDSVGQQPTTGFTTNWCDIAKSCGYDNIIGCVDEENDIINAVKQLSDTPGPSFLEIRSKPGSRGDLGRPKETPIENKRGFMQFLQK